MKLLSPVVAVCLAVAGAAGAEPVDLRALQAVAIPAGAGEPEREMAGVLLAGLERAYAVTSALTNALPPAGRGAVLLGREMALASGMVDAQELDAVKFDGFVIKASSNRVAIAGYQPQGTMFGTYAFLRRIGVKHYPWRDGGAAMEVLAPLSEPVLAPFTLADRPFFLRRDLLSWLDRGRWGTSLREYGGLGEFRFVQDHEYFKDKGWLGGDHTAPYLVPMGKYYDEHPEYFGFKQGKRIPKDTQNMRVVLCLSSPEVHRIAAERALEWMEIQRERRFFHITDGDASACTCPACLALDPLPGSCADRNLRWVNSVAREVRKTFPDNVLLAVAYGCTTKPPVREAPESNVVVMYAPWYWNSRATSAVSWASPLNITAMKEFMGWHMKFPDQMGLYDYPGSWVQGQADRLKFLAKRNARVFYSCGGNGDLFQWVNSRLLWDPFLNPDDLIAEFVPVYYGPAAEPMAAYLRMRQEAIDRHFVHSRDAFSEPAYLNRMRDLMGRAADLVADADPMTRARVLTQVIAGLREVLGSTHPVKGRDELRADADAYRAALERFIRLSEQVIAIWEERGNRYMSRQRKQALDEALSALGLTAPPAEPAERPLEELGEEPDEEETLFDRAIASLDDQIRKSGKVEQVVESRPPRSVTVPFDGPGETNVWMTDGSQAALVSPPAPRTVSAPSGASQTGLAVRAPLSALPVIPYHKLQIHAGRFYAERRFDPPLQAEGHYLDVHLFASRDVPLTVYMNEIHSDFDLHAGEQIVRIDLRNYDRFDFKEWDKAIHRVSFDIWPQDNYDPHPEVHDTDIVFFSLTTGNRKPSPDRLPHQGQAVWLSQFRPNIPNGVTVPRERYDELMQRQHYRHAGLDYGSRWIAERFRTFTEHRAVSPVFAILTGGGEARETAAAEALQGRLQELFGVALPINPPGLSAGPHLGNAILVGKAACLAAERITAQELSHVGPRGFVIHAHQGRVAIAGPDAAGTAHGVARYLQDHGVRFFGPASVHVPDLPVKLLHELYLLDWPSFKGQSVQGDWPLEARGGPGRAGARGDAAEARALAEQIKDAARAGRREIPAGVMDAANRTALNRYVAANLLWDPFADSTRLIREFEAKAR